MFNAYKNLISGRFMEIEDNKLFILNRWASFSMYNAESCSKIDRISLGCKNKDLLKFLLSNTIVKRMPKFLKSNKEDKILFNYLKQYFDWSTQELNHQIKMINVNDKELLNKMALYFGWDKKTCKQYNVNWDEPKKEKIIKRRITHEKFI